MSETRHKSTFISALQEGATVTEFYRVEAVSTRMDKKQRPYLAVTLGDRTGKVEGRMWGTLPEPLPASGSFVLCKATVDPWHGSPQLNLESLTPVDSKELDIGDFMAASKKDIPALYGQIMAAVGKLDEPYKILLSDLLTAHKDRFCRAPAAKTNHHGYLGGLAEHCHSMLCTALWVCENKNYKLDRDLLVAGVLLHDFAKAWEYQYDTGISFSTVGQFLGHIFIGAQMVTEACNRLKVPKEISRKIVHLILSHHGEKEFGSPVEPVLREAFALHAIDKLDAALAAFDAGLENLPEGAEWTNRIPMLGRAVYAR